MATNPTSPNGAPHIRGSDTSSPVPRPHPTPTLQSILTASPSLTPMLRPTGSMGGLTSGDARSPFPAALPATTRTFSPADAIAMRGLQVTALTKHLDARLGKELDPVIKALDTLSVRAAQSNDGAATSTAAGSTGAGVATSLGKVLQRVEVLEGSYGPLLTELASLFPSVVDASSPTVDRSPASRIPSSSNAGYGSAALLLSDALLMSSPNLLFHQPYPSGEGHSLSSYSPPLQQDGNAARRQTPEPGTIGSGLSHAFLPPPRTMRNATSILEALERLRAANGAEVSTATTPATKQLSNSQARAEENVGEDDRTAFDFEMAPSSTFIPESILLASPKHRREQAAFAAIQQLHADTQRRGASNGANPNRRSWRRQKPPQKQQGGKTTTAATGCGKAPTHAKSGDPSPVWGPAANPRIPTALFAEIAERNCSSDCISFVEWFGAHPALGESQRWGSAAAEMPTKALSNADDNSNKSLLASFDALRESYATSRLIGRDVVEYLVATNRPVSARKAARAFDQVAFPAANVDAASSLEEQFPSLHPALRQGGGGSLVDIRPLLAQHRTTSSSPSRGGSVMGGTGSTGRPPMPPPGTTFGNTPQQNISGMAAQSDPPSVMSTPIRRPLSMPLSAAATPPPHMGGSFSSSNNNPPHPLRYSLGGMAPLPPSVAEASSAAWQAGGSSSDLLLQVSKSLARLRGQVADLHDFICDSQEETKSKSSLGDEGHSQPPPIVSAKRRLKEVKIQEASFRQKSRAYLNALYDAIVLAFLAREAGLRHLLLLGGNASNSHFALVDDEPCTRPFNQRPGISKLVQTAASASSPDDEGHDGDHRFMGEDLFWRPQAPSPLISETGGVPVSADTSLFSSPAGAPTGVGNTFNQSGTSPVDDADNGGSPFSTNPRHRTISAVLNASHRTLLRYLLASFSNSIPASYGMHSCPTPEHNNWGPSSVLVVCLQYLFTVSEEFTPTLLRGDGGAAVPPAPLPATATTDFHLHRNTVAFLESILAVCKGNTLKSIRLTPEGRLQMLVAVCRALSAVVLEQNVEHTNSTSTESDTTVTLVGRYNALIDASSGLRDLLSELLYGDLQHSSTKVPTVPSHEPTSSASQSNRNGPADLAVASSTASATTAPLVSVWSESPATPRSSSPIGSPLDLLRSLFSAANTNRGRGAGPLLQLGGSVPSPAVAGGGPTRTRQSFDDDSSGSPLPPKISSSAMTRESAPPFTLKWYLQVLASTKMGAGDPRDRKRKPLVGRPTSNWSPPTATTPSSFDNDAPSPHDERSKAIHAALDDNIFLGEVGCRIINVSHSHQYAGGPEQAAPPPTPPRLVLRAAVASISTIDAMSRYVATPASAAATLSLLEGGEGPLSVHEWDTEEQDGIEGFHTTVNDFRSPPMVSFEKDARVVLARRRLAPPKSSSPPPHLDSVGRRFMFGTFLVMLVEGGLFRRTADAAMVHPATFFRPDLQSARLGRRRRDGNAHLLVDASSDSSSSNEEEKGGSDVFGGHHQHRHSFHPSAFLDRLSQFEAVVIAVRRPNAIYCPYSGLDLLGDGVSELTTTTASRAALLRGSFLNSVTKNKYREAAAGSPCSLLHVAHKTLFGGAPCQPSTLYPSSLMSADGASTALTVSLPPRPGCSFIVRIGPLANPFHVTPFATIDRFPSICGRRAPSSKGHCLTGQLNASLQYPATLFELAVLIRKVGMRRWKMEEDLELFDDEKKGPDEDKSDDTHKGKNKPEEDEGSPIDRSSDDVPTFVIPFKDILYIETGDASFSPSANYSRRSAAFCSASTLRDLLPQGKPVTLPNGVTISDSLLPFLAVYVPEENAFDIISSSTARGGRNSPSGAWVHPIRSANSTSRSATNFTGVSLPSRLPGGSSGVRFDANSGGVTIVSSRGASTTATSTNIPFAQLVRRHLFWQGIESDRPPLAVADFLQSGVGLQAAVAAATLAQEAAEEEGEYSSDDSVGDEEEDEYSSDDSVGDEEDVYLEVPVRGGSATTSSSAEEGERSEEDPYHLLSLIESAIMEHGHQSAGGNGASNRFFSEVAAGQEEEECAEEVQQQLPSPPVRQFQAHAATELSRVPRGQQGTTTATEVFVAAGDGGDDDDGNDSGGESNAATSDPSTTSASRSSSVAEEETGGAPIEVVAPPSANNGKLPKCATPRPSHHSLALESVLLLLSHPLHSVDVVDRFRSAAIHGEDIVVEHELNRALGIPSSYGRLMAAWRRGANPSSARSASTRYDEDEDYDDNDEPPINIDGNILASFFDQPSARRTGSAAAELPTGDIAGAVALQLRAITQGRNLVLAMTSQSNAEGAVTSSRLVYHNAEDPDRTVVPSPPRLARQSATRSVSRNEHRPTSFDDEEDFTNPRLGLPPPAPRATVRPSFFPTPRASVTEQRTSPTAPADRHRNTVSALPSALSLSYTLKVMCPRTGELFELMEVKQAFFL